MVIPTIIGYQYVCLRSYDALEAFTHVKRTIQEAIELGRPLSSATDVPNDNFTHFVIGPYALYDCNGKKIEVKRANRIYRRLDRVDICNSGCFTTVWPMGYVFDRCPFTKTTAPYYAVTVQYPLDGREPIAIGCSECNTMAEAKKAFKTTHVEELDDGPVFKAIVRNRSQRPGGDVIMRPCDMLVYTKEGHRARIELEESILGVKFHPIAAEKAGLKMCICQLA